MVEEAFNPKDLKNLKRIGVKYDNSEGKSRIIDANILFISDNNITLSTEEKDLKLAPPQIVNLKYVFDNALCDADTILDNIKEANGLTYLIIDHPKKVTKINRRKYYRLKLKRTCVLTCTYEDGRSDSFLSRLVDISLGGVFFHKLESMSKDDYVKIDPEKYVAFNIVLFLDVDVVLKIPVRFVRQEKGRVSYRCAFEFLEMKKKSAEKLGQFLTKEQIKQRKLHEQAKNNL
ncbi:PilZ domain-containing protein [bacterium]|nr:PilZ domain-containing protein [bacterium]